MATGEAAFLVGDGAGGDGAGFASVQGDTANLAARMEALAAPGAVYVHGSTADRWAAEAAGRATPEMAWVECKGRGLQRAAVFDCEAGAFRAAGSCGPTGTVAAAAAASGAGEAAKRLWRSASGPI